MPSLKPCDGWRMCCDGRRPCMHLPSRQPCCPLAQSGSSRTHAPANKRGMVFDAACRGASWISDARAASTMSGLVAQQHTERGGSHKHAEALADQVTMPVRHVLVCDAGGHIEHDDSALPLDVVAIAKPTELLLHTGWTTRISVCTSRTLP